MLPDVWQTRGGSPLVQPRLTSGARVQGELLAFDSYHKRSKVLYDDGEEEWVALQREMFTWLTPRARAAGVCSTGSMMPKS